MEEYKLWLEKAKDDILWTKSNLEGGIYYGACFSAQQAVEKAFKAFLIYHKKSLRKIHDVVSLLEDCIKVDESYKGLVKDTQVLIPYYVTTRYPVFEDIASFNKQQAEEAFEIAQEIIKFVEKKLPAY